MTISSRSYFGRGFITRGPTNLNTIFLRVAYLFIPNPTPCAIDSTTFRFSIVFSVNFNIHPHARAHTSHTSFEHIRFFALKSSLLNNGAQFEEKLEPCITLLLFPNLCSSECKRKANAKYVHVPRSSSKFHFATSSSCSCSAMSIYPPSYVHVSLSFLLYVHFVSC